MEALSRERPLVLVLEDLHDGAQATAELISYPARRPEPARLLLLGSYRPAGLIARGHPLHRVVQDLGARGLCARPALELLSSAEVDGYPRARLAPRIPPARLTAEVYQRTEGNAPFTAIGDFRDIQMLRFSSRPPRAARPAWTPCSGPCGG